MGTKNFNLINMSDDEQFEQADSGAMTFPTSAGSIRKGSHMLINGFPCKVAEVTTSKTGKHGHAKANITAIDVFTGKKYEEVAPTSHSLPSPVVKRSVYQLIDVKPDGFLSLMDEANNTRDDMALPADQEMADKIKEAFDNGDEVSIVVMSAMGKECVMEFKTPQS